MIGLEFGILDGIQQLRSPWMDFWMTRISFLGNSGWIWIVLALLLICFPKTRKVGLAMGLGLILCLLIGNVTLKPLIARIRPFALREFLLLIDAPSDFSFPSGHTFSSFVGAGVLFFSGMGKRFWIPGLVLACLIAFSRLYLYVHYPTDVLAGVVLGLLVAFVSVYAIRKIFEKRGEKPRNTEGATKS